MRQRVAQPLRRDGEPGSPNEGPLSVASRNRRLLNEAAAGQPIAPVSSTTNLEIDMSKPRLQLIHCSNGIRLGGKPRHHGRSFRPLVIHGGARAKSAPRESAWEAAVELIDLSFSISLRNYRAFLQASITILQAYNRTDPEKTS